MFNLRLCDAATIRYSQLKFGHMHLCGVDYKYFSPHCCKCNSFGCTTAIRCGNACRGPHTDSLNSGSEHSQFNSPRLVKREADFPNRRQALIGSNQLWRVDDSPHYRELREFCRKLTTLQQNCIVVSAHDNTVPLAKYAFSLMDAKIWMISLIIMFTVHPISGFEISNWIDLSVRQVHCNKANLRDLKAATGL